MNASFVYMPGWHARTFVVFFDVGACTHSGLGIAWSCTSSYDWHDGLNWLGMH